MPDIFTFVTVITCYFAILCSWWKLFFAPYFGFWIMCDKYEKITSENHVARPCWAVKNHHSCFLILWRIWFIWNNVSDASQKPLITTILIWNESLSILGLLYWCMMVFAIPISLKWVIHLFLPSYGCYLSSVRQELNLYFVLVV